MVYWEYYIHINFPVKLNTAKNLASELDKLYSIIELMFHATLDYS